MRTRSAEPAPENMRHVLRRLPTGVVVVTTGNDGPIGMAVGSFVSISLDPPLVGFFVDHGSSTWPKMRSAAAFAVNVLDERHRDLCRAFSTKDIDRFAGVAWQPGLEGAPLLDGVAAQLECTFHEVIGLGDHDLVVGRVVRISEGSPSDRPLVFYGGALIPSLVPEPNA